MTTQASSIKIVDETVRADGRIESGTVALQSTTLTAANFDAERGFFNDVVAAVTAITLGNVTETKQAGLHTFIIFPAPASDPDAQIERRWKMLGKINSAARNFKAWSRTIPAADITDKLATEERLDPAATTFTNLKAAIEVYVKDAGDPIILERVILVGQP